MTSPKSQARPRRTRGRRVGFTLVELLVVIGILVILISILTPAVLRAMKQARKTKQISDLQAIAVALNAYKDDFSDYPRLPPPNTAAQPNNRGPSDTGDTLLAWALVAPYDAGVDGAAGPGFRIRANAKVSGPYMPVDRVKIKLFGPYFKFVDRSASENPILYYAGRPGVQGSVYAGPSAAAFYDTSYCTPDLSAAITAAGQSSKFNGPFILWAAGEDGIYGTKDDVSTIP
jgi:prepilin-type N-terminal cleavage/methylation domain-containing protein